MRNAITIVVGTALALAACGKGENAGAEEAKRQADQEQKQKQTSATVAKKLTPPVPGQAKLPCSQVIDATKFAQVLGETLPLTVVEAKPEQHDPDAAASCSLIRGGKHSGDSEQKSMIKKNGKLGVLAGDEICNVQVYCWTIEDPDRVHKKCEADKGAKVDDTLGFDVCMRIVAEGADDVKTFRFYDDDTKCLIGVRGGPSNVDNDLIGKCAKAAHDLIGPAQIAVSAGGAAPAAGTPPG
jgi:hypothetical protein